MAKKDVSEIVRGAGFLTAIASALQKAVREAGGNDGDIHFLTTPDAEALWEKFGKEIVLRHGRRYPAEGEIFELTLDADDPSCHPLVMVRGDGYDPTNWKYTGERLTGVCTGKFKLVSVGYCRNLDEVRQKLTPHGIPAEGQWREAFKKAYPTPDGKGPVGFADPSWVLPDSDRRFPYVGSSGWSSFDWAGSDFDDVWRWLVAVSE